MKKLIALTLAVLMAAMTFAFAGCGSKGTDDQKTNDTIKSDLAYIKEKGTMIIGITDYKPMNYKDADGKWIGFDTELAEAFCEEIGVKAEFLVLGDWDSKFTELSAKAIDCIWNGMTITDEALKNSSVSDAYLKNSQVVVLPYDKAIKCTTVDNLKDMTFAVESGSAGETSAKDNSLKATAVKDQSAALLETKSGSCDGCIIDKTMADATVGEGTSYSTLSVAMTLSTEEFGISFRTGSDVTAALNSFIANYKESGEFNKLAEKYSVTVE